MPDIVLKYKNKMQVFDQLIELKNLGLSYKVKDCSLNGKYPVVGLLVYNKDKSKYLFTVGSDPNFNIALQRCVTEMFQGMETSEIEQNMKKWDNDYGNLEKKDADFVTTNWLKCYIANSGIHPKIIFENEEKVSLKKLKFIDDNYCKNEICLEYLLNIIKENKLDIYVKDYSFMQFPTYKVYIPTLSEVDYFTETEFEFCAKRKQFNDIYFNINNYNKDNNEFERLLLGFTEKSRYNELIPPDNLFNAKSINKSAYIKLNYFYILLIILLKNKDYKKVTELIKSKLHKKDSDQYTKQYLETLLSVVKKGNNINNSDDIFKNDANSFVYNTKAYVETMLPPSCPNCKGCKSKKYCDYKTWKKIDETLYNCYSSWNNDIIKRG